MKQHPHCWAEGVEKDRSRSTVWLSSHLWSAGGLMVFPGPKEKEGPELHSGMHSQDLGRERATISVTLSSGLVTLTLLLFDVVDCATPEAAGLSASSPNAGLALSPGALGTRTTASWTRSAARGRTGSQGRVWVLERGAFGSLWRLQRLLLLLWHCWASRLKLERKRTFSYIRALGSYFSSPWAGAVKWSLKFSACQNPSQEDKKWFESARYLGSKSWWESQGIHSTINRLIYSFS